MCFLYLDGVCGINWAEKMVNHVGQLEGLYSVKVEGKVQPRTGQESLEGE